MPESHSLSGGQRLVNVHDLANCSGGCPLHYPSDHPMREWPLHYRDDRGIFERLCPHGIGHPDPDNLKLFERGSGQGIHGCDGCCAVLASSTSTSPEV